MDVIRTLPTLDEGSREACYLAVYRLGFPPNGKQSEELDRITSRSICFSTDVPAPFFLRNSV
jgi:hypothetical protein